MGKDRTAQDPGTTDSPFDQGCPCGLRITVATVLNLLASGSSREQILEAYPQLEPADIEAAITYTARYALQGPGASGTVS
ncbi:DUF433 domain-containing protein [Microcystis elabens FACHB-917]|nr:DUF433 domain-containing protein [Microcystis elabens FACHB-917]